MKAALITNSSFRHKYVAHCLARQLQLVGIVAESKQNIITTTPAANKPLSRQEDIYGYHDALRFKSEFDYFGAHQQFAAAPLFGPKMGELNTPATLDFLLQIQPDIVLLFGSSIVKPMILNAFEGRVLNLHLGLSPYYRGSATNLFALADRQPECVGATFHKAVAKVDAGAIVHQIRPKFALVDDVHSIGNNTLRDAGLLYADVARQYMAGNTKPIPQTLMEGKLTTTKDISPELLQRLYQNFETGMMSEFIDHQELRLLKYPIFSCM